MPNKSRRRRERCWRNRYRRLRAQLADSNALREAYPRTVERIEDAVVADVKRIRSENGSMAAVVSRMLDYADTAKGRLLMLLRGHTPLSNAGYEGMEGHRAARET